MSTLLQGIEYVTYSGTCSIYILALVLQNYAESIEHSIQQLCNTAGTSFRAGRSMKFETVKREVKEHDSRYLKTMSSYFVLILTLNNYCFDNILNGDSLSETIYSYWIRLKFMWMKGWDCCTSHMSLLLNLPMLLRAW